MSGEKMDATAIRDALNQANLVPFDVGRYRAVAAISQTPGCDVYKAVDPKFEVEDEECFVAIKLLAPGLPAIREAAAARRVSHANVASVLDWGTIEDADLGRREYVVYELVDWPTLDLCKQDYKSQRAAVTLIEKIARGVAACHAAGLVHGDLKPNNIAVTPDGNPYVLDFGSAVRPGEPSHCSVLFGAPEQREAAGFSSDTYSLGQVLFWLSVGEFLDRQDDGDDDLRWIVRRATSRYPNGRQRSVEAFADELRCWLDHRPLSCTPMHRRALLLLRRRPLESVGAAAALFAVVAAGLVVAWNVGRARLIADREFNTGEAAKRLAAVADAIEGLPVESLPEVDAIGFDDLYQEVALGGVDSERLVLMRSLGAIARAFESVRDDWDRDQMLAVESQLADLDAKMEELGGVSPKVHRLLLSARAMLWHRKNLADEAKRAEMIRRSNEIR